MMPTPNTTSTITPITPAAVTPLFLKYSAVNSPIAQMNAIATVNTTIRKGSVHGVGGRLLLSASRE